MDPGASPKRKILLIDGNPPWVRSLFSAVAKTVEVRALNVRVGWSIDRGWRATDDGIINRTICVPGWTKLPRLSAALLGRAIRSARKKFGIDLLVYTLPFYAPIASRFAGQLTQVYYAHDPFRFYEWNITRTLALEAQMLEACDATFAISQTLAEDFEPMSQRPIIYSPNAVSSQFLSQLSAGGPVADELRSLPRPIVGCVGQMNKSYDWPLIAAMADELPNATFVFVGPIFNEPPDVQQPMKAALAKHNVKWLGPKPHARLPEFLRGFDICFNPLAITDHNNRRSPLRLYDYLATDRPILSTAIREALVHEPLIQTFTTPSQGAQLVRQIQHGDIHVDMSERSRYIRLNTWEARAMEFLRHIESLQKTKGPR